MNRSLTKIIGLTFLVQLAIFALGLVNNVFLSRWLGPGNLGIVALFFLFAEVVHKVTNPGIETAAMYYLSNRKHPPEQTIFTALIGGLGVFLLGSVLIVLFVKADGLKLFFDPQEARILRSGAFWCIFLLLAYMIFDYGSKIVLGFQQFVRYNKIILLRPIIFFLALLLVYFFGHLTLVTVLAIYSISWLIPGLVMLGNQGISLRRGKFSRTVFQDLLQYGSKIMVNNLLLFLNYRVDVFLIGYFWNKEMVGWYYVALVISEKLLYLAQATSTVFLPAASQSEEQQLKTPIFARVNLWTVLAGAVIVGLVSPRLIPWLFSSQYQNSVLPLILLLPGIVLITLPKVLSADFSAKGKPEFSVYTGLVNFLTNLGLNLILIPRWGIAGAAISSSVSYAVAAVLMLYFYHRNTGVKIHDLLIVRREDWYNVTRII